jgi:hypothetical protein
MTFIAFLAGPAGRLLRIAAGTAMVAVGAAVGGGWWGLAVLGLVPLLAGTFDVCVLAPLFRLPFAGSRLRALRR